MDFTDLLSTWNINIGQEEIFRRWSEPHRTYHALSHLEDLVHQIHIHAELTQKERDMLTLAAIFHDIIYDPRRGDNEERSAALFLAHSPLDVDTEEIASIIRDTKTHKPSTHLSAIFSHMDMSVVRQPYEKLLTWEHGIKAEYRHLPGVVYCVARAYFLSKMIKKYPENAEALSRLRKKVLFP